MRKQNAYYLVLILAVFGATAVAAQEPAWEEYISGQKKVQVKTHYHLGLQAGHLKPLLEKSQELQLAMADQKSSRFYYLLGHHPERIDRDHGFSNYVNFGWTETDENSLVEQDGDYRQLKEKIEKLTEEVEKDPQWEALKYNLQALKDDIHYQEVISPFRFVPDRVEEILNRQKAS